MEDDFKIEIDPTALFQQMMDKTFADFMAAMMPDEQSRKLISGIFSIHRKYGIDTATSTKIIMELGELFKKLDSNK